MKTIFRLIFATGFLLLNACATIGNIPQEKKEYLKFVSRKNYPQTYSTYVDTKLLTRKKKNMVRAKVDLDRQRIRLVIDGQTALDSPATTGKQDYETPTGIFPILEKKENKESNLYGRFYKDGKLVYTGSEKEYKEENAGEELEYDEYKGTSLASWMRLTRDGVGIHQSQGIFRRPASHGCIRIPAKTSKILYSRLKVGSLVTVIKSDSLPPGKDVKVRSLSIKERLQLLRKLKKNKNS